MWISIVYFSCCGSMLLVFSYWCGRLITHDLQDVIFCRDWFSFNQLLVEYAWNICCLYVCVSLFVFSLRGASEVSISTLCASYLSPSPTLFLPHPPSFPKHENFTIGWRLRFIWFIRHSCAWANLFEQRRFWSVFMHKRCRLTLHQQWTHTLVLLWSILVERITESGLFEPLNYPVKYEMQNG